MPSQNIEKITLDGKTYDFDSLSADAKGTLTIITELNGKINEFKKEAHFLEVSRGVYEQQLTRQMPTSSIEDKESKDKDEQDKDSGKSTSNGTKSGWTFDWDQRHR